MHLLTKDAKYNSVIRPFNVYYFVSNGQIYTPGYKTEHKKLNEAELRRAKSKQCCANQNVNLRRTHITEHVKTMKNQLAQEHFPVSRTKLLHCAGLALSWFHYNAVRFELHAGFSTLTPLNELSHTVEAVVHLWSLGVLTAAGCGIGSVHAVVRSNLLVEPSEMEEGEISVFGALLLVFVQEQRAIAAHVSAARKFLKYFKSAAADSFDPLIINGPTQVVTDMSVVFSEIDAPFMPSSKKQDMKVEYRPLNDIVAKSLTAKAGSFDAVKGERFEIMVAISTEIKLVQADLGESVALHPLMVLNTKSIHTCKLKNQASVPKMDGKKHTGNKAGKVAEPKKKALQGRKQPATPSLQFRVHSHPEIFLPKKKFRTQRSSKIKPISAVRAGDAQESISEVADEEADVAQQGETASAPMEERIPDAIWNSGAGAPDEIAVGGTASADPHQEECFVHWSGCPATKTIEIREINWATHFLPKFDPATKHKEIPIAFEWPNPVEEHCTKVLKYIDERVAPWVTQFDHWKKFRTEVRLNSILSMIPIEELVKIEDDLMIRAETERVSELLLRRDLIRSKMVEEFLQKSMEKHWKPFVLDQLIIWAYMRELKHEAFGCAEETRTESASEHRSSSPIAEHQAPVGLAPVITIPSLSSLEKENNEDTLAFAIVQYTQALAEDITEAIDFSEAQAAVDSPISHSVDFQKQTTTITAIDTSVANMHDEQAYVKYDFQQLKRTIYKRIDDLLEWVEHSQASMESRIVTRIHENHQQMSTNVATLSYQIAEIVACLRDRGHAKQGESGINEKIALRVEDNSTQK
ncbi:spermine synthase [Dorcoceras hygrometricum]|uniref:Spermine synthase n=1 Tax=Dorcoceras hygrometricum TaxID=472368 RepID=A0A2Z7CVM1_9LAMI|nr:spermine synthase [Dorcoceras hygrometricum]